MSSSVLNPIIDPAYEAEAVAHDPFTDAPLAVYLPSTPPQREVWLASQMGLEGNLAYNEGLQITLRGVLDEAALRSALQTVIDRHEGLRTVFSADGDWMLVRSSMALALELADVRAATDPAAALADLEEREMTTPFDLEAGPLVRFTLVRTADEEHHLLFVGHHLSCDGWSGAVVITELGALYSAAVDQAVRPLPPAPRYGDYALLDREFQDSEAGATHRRYWLENLKGLTESPAAPPPDLLPPVPAKLDADRIDAPLPPELVAKLRAQGAKHGASLTAISLAGFAALLHRLTGAVDLIIGLAAAGQSFHQQKMLVGHCVNLLPLRIRLAGATSFTEVLKITRDAVLDAYEHQGVTFGSVLPELDLKRDPARPPLVAVTFNIDVRNDDIRHSGLSVGYRTMVRRAEIFELFINLVDNGRDVLIEANYRSSLYSRGYVQARIDEYVQLLAAVAEDTELPLAELPLLSPALRARLLAPPAIANPVVSTLHGRFAEAVARFGDRTALTFEKQTLSYAKLDARANQLARALQERGVARGDLVGFYLDRSLQPVEAILAVLKAGAAYLPIDPAYPADRVAHMLGDSGARLVLTESALAAQLPAAVDRLVLDAPETRSAMAAFFAGPLTVESAPQDLAYVIYTSGSTGQPKGCQVSHANATRLFTSTAPWFGFHERDVWTLFHSTAFDFSVWEIWGALLHGGRLVVVPYWAAREPDRFAALLASEGVTVLNQTPSAFRQLMTAALARGAAPLPALRTVVFGGEALELQSLKPWFAHFGDGSRGRGARLVNMYGITETTVHVTYRPLSMADVEGERAPSVIGEPIPDLSLHVLDARMQPVPVGITGEIWVGGAGVALGYLNRPELTAERFVPSPFHPGQRLYKTGDLARWLPAADGLPRDLEYLGRIDHQVKLRGFRIELGEIEAALNRHPGIAESFATVVEHAGDPRLVAYLVWREGSRPLAREALLEHLASRLPDYMLPQRFVTVPRFPLTTNGKLDRKALPDPFAEVQDTAGSAPRTAAERWLAGQWAQLLGTRAVSRDAKFFELGGHSLLAVRLMGLVREATGVRLPLREWMSEPLSALAAKLPLPDDAPAALPAATETIIAGNPLYEAPAPGARLGLDAAGNPAWFGEDRDGRLHALGTSVALAHDPFAGSPLAAALPLTDAQREITLAVAYDPSSSASYHLSRWLAIEGELHLGALRRALALLVERHESLRARVSPSGEHLLVAAQGGAECPLTDLSNEADPEAAALHQARKMLAEPFDLTQGPLSRLQLYRLGPTRHRLLWVVHHLVCDGESLAVLMQELSLATRHLARGEAVPLPPAPRFGDYVQRLHQELASRGESDTQWWLGQLADPPPPMEWPLSLPRRAQRDFTSQTLHHRFSAGATEALRALSQQASASPLAVLLALLAVHAKKLGREEDALFGVPAASPALLGMHGLVGHGANVLPVRIKTGDESVAAAIGASRETLLAAIDHGQLSLGSLLPLLALPRDASRPTLISMLVDLGQDEAALDFGGAPVRTESLSTGTEFFELYLRFGLGAEGLSVELIYASALYAEADLRERLGELDRLLVNAAANADTAALALDWVSPEGQSRWQALNATGMDWGGATLVERIAAQALATPEAIALRTGEVALSYRALAARAGAIATALREAGVGRGQFVGLSVQRGPDLLPGLLGILATGAAYLPLDPDFPADRLAYLLEDSGASLVLTDEASATKLSGTAAKLVDLGSVQGEAPFTAPAGGAADPAFVIYTSGSTGKPKGVVVPQRGVVNVLLDIARRLAVTPGEVQLGVTTMSFDIAACDFFMPLLTGGTLLLAGPDEVQDGERLLRLIAAHDVRLLQCTPATWRLLLAAGWQGSAGMKAVSTGEPLSRDLAEQLLPRVAGLWNLYGPTETTIWSTAQRITGAGAILIGEPVANTQCLVLDAGLRPVPPGVTGRLWIGGDGVALGYHQRPELTASRFVTHAEFGRLYDTGDLARLTPDGLECLGRVDFQVKLRGYRIELGEIEYALSRHNGVADSAVMVRTRAAGDARLVAYVVLKPGEAATPSELRQAARGFLPSYMVPQDFVMLPALPRLPNGKLDRKALPDPFAASAGSARGGREPPETAAEQALAALWAEVLQLADASGIGRHDRFFDLGGHSLLALRLAARIQETTGQRPVLRTLMMDPLSIVAQGLALAPKGDVTPAAPAPALAARRIDDLLIPTRTSPPRKKGWLARLLGD